MRGFRQTHFFFAATAIAAFILSHSPAFAGAHNSPERAGARLELLGLSPSGDALTRAILRGHTPLVNLLLAARADVNGADEEGRTPLLAATVAGNWAIAAKLIEAGADPRLVDENGVTPLMIAAGRGHAPTFKALMERGGDVRAEDGAGRAALHYAVAGGHAELALQLLASYPAEAPLPANHRELLSLAVQTQDWRLITPVLERMPDGEQWDFHARSALAQALQAKDVARIRLVLSKFSGAPAPEGRRQPLLAYAAAANDLEMGELLLKAGADPNTLVEGPIDAEFLQFITKKFLRHYIVDEPGMSTLMVAAGLGHTQFVKLLLEHGATRGQATRSKHKLVALYFAAWAESAETLQVLLGNAPSPSELRIHISLGSQNATLYKQGVPVLRSNISSGRSGFSTPTGQFVVTDKKQSHVSSIYHVKMPFFMRLSCRDFGLHQGHVTGSPASHGCIRLPADVARKMFQEVPIGTLVTIAH